MFGSTTPVGERPDLHPVHRANALLRSALLRETAPVPDFDFSQDFDAIAGPEDGGVGIAYPTSLVERLNALDIGTRLQSGIRLPLSFTEPRELTGPAAQFETEAVDVPPDEDWEPLEDGLDAALPVLSSAQEAHMAVLLKE